MRAGPMYYIPSLDFADLSKDFQKAWKRMFLQSIVVFFLLVRVFLYIRLNMSPVDG